mgnify:CR=1 FL=1
MADHSVQGPVRVVLANDDHIIIEGLRAMLRPYEDQVEVVATAQGDPEITLVAEVLDGADVMLIDAFSRTAGGIDAAVKVLAEDPPFAVAIFPDADDLRLMLQAMRVGVRGYLLKSAKPAEKAAAEKIGVVFPNQKDRGAHVNISGARLIA